MIGKPQPRRHRGAGSRHRGYGILLSDKDCVVHTTPWHRSYAPCGTAPHVHRVADYTGGDAAEREVRVVGVIGIAKGGHPAISPALIREER